MAGGERLRALESQKTTNKEKQPTTFLSLPAELRNYIYDLSGCLTILQCRNCHSTIRGDDEDIKYLSCCFYSYDGLSIDCEYREKAYLWVNRKSRRKADDDCGRHIGWDETHSMEEHLDEHVVDICQPALTKVNKQIRAETLPVFYGNHNFMFTAFRYEDIFDAPIKWLAKIGNRNLKLVKEIMVVLPYAKDERGRTELKRQMAELLRYIGCRAEVKFKSYEFGRCRCETCVLRKEPDKVRWEA